MAKSFKKATRMRGGFRPSARGAVKTAKTLYNSVPRPLKQQLAEQVAGLEMTAIVPIVQKTMKRMKAPVAVSGRNLNHERAELVDTAGATSTTMSTSIYMHRPPRARKPSDAVTGTVTRQRSFKVEHFTTVTDQQKIGTINCLLLRPELNNPDNNQTYHGLTVEAIFDHNLRAKMSNESATTVTPPLTSQNAHLKTLTSTLQFVSGSNKGAIIEIYDVIPKFTTNEIKYASAVKGDNDNVKHCCSEPTVAWTQGVLETLQTGDVFIANVIGSKPTDSDYFRACWDITKKTEIRMTTNQVHRHRLVFGINKTINQLESNAAGSGAASTFCPFHLITVRGYAVHTTDEDPGDGSLAAGGVLVKVIQDLRLDVDYNSSRISRVIDYDKNK